MRMISLAANLTFYAVALRTEMEIAMLANEDFRGDTAREPIEPLAGSIVPSRLGIPSRLGRIQLI